MPRADSGGLATGTAAAAAVAAASAATAAAAAFSRATGFEAPGFYSSSPSSGAALAAAGGTAGVSATGGSSSSSNPPEPGGSSSRGAKGSDFKAAWDLLQRSLACFLKDKAAKNGMQLAAAWNPLAWLVVYCAVVRRDTQQDGKLVALSTRVNAAAAAAVAGRLAEGGVAANDAVGFVSEGALGSMVVGAAGGPGVPAVVAAAAAAAADTPGGCGASR